MADARALTLQGGRYTQIQDADELQVGGGIDRATAGALTIGVATATSIDIGNATTCPISMVGKVDTDLIFAPGGTRMIAIDDALAGAGNQLEVYGGDAASGAGGALGLYGGDGTSGDGGMAILKGGSCFVSGTPGLAVVAGGNTTTAGLNGGSSAIRGGNAGAGGTDGTVIIGDIETSAINIGPADGSSTLTSISIGGAAGLTTLNLGTGMGAGDNISIGAANVATHMYGSTTIDALVLANLELTNTAGVHYMRIATGNAASSLEVYSANTTAAASGAITLKSGNALGGVSGAVNITSGTSDTGASGAVNIDSGVGTGSNGVVNIGTSNAPDINLGGAATTISLTGIVDTVVRTSNGGFQRTAAGAMSLGTDANTTSLALGTDNACTTIDIGTGTGLTSLDIGTGMTGGVTTMNIGTSMTTGDAINIGGAGCDVNINGNLDVLGTSEFDQNVVIGDGVSGPDTLAFHNAADPNGGYLGSASMPDVRWLRDVNHSFYIAEASAAAGTNLTIAAAKGAATFSGGTLLLNGGAGGAGGAANGGGVTVTGGAAGGGVAGTVTLGATNTATVEIGAAAIATNVNGALTVDGNTTLGDAGTDTLDVYPYWSTHRAYDAADVWSSRFPFTLNLCGVTSYDAAVSTNPVIVALKGKSASSGTPGFVGLFGGDTTGSSTTAAGLVAIVGGWSTSSGNAKGGEVDIVGGQATGNAAGGDVNITGGAANTVNGTGNGGGASLQGGDGGATSGTGGGVEIKGGSAVGGGGGGDIQLLSGAGIGANTSGLISIYTDLPGATGASGQVSIYTGPGGATSGASGQATFHTGTTTSGATGQITMYSGNATAGNSGLISIYTGTTTTSGNSGAISVTTGNSAVNSGDITLSTGTAVTTRGSIIIGNDSSQPITWRSVALQSTVTGTNLNTLTNGGDATALHTHSSGTADRIDIDVTAGENLAAGEIVAMNNSGGVPRAYKADANGAAPLYNVVGIAPAAVTSGNAGTVAVAGEVAVPDAAWAGGVPAVGDVGKVVYMSETAGSLTLTAPSTALSWVQKVGVVSVGGTGAVKVVIQIGDGVQL